MKEIINKNNNKKYIVSVVDVQKKVSIPRKIGDIEIGSANLNHIIYEAAIFDKAKTRFYAKPLFVMYLEDGTSQPMTKEEFKIVVEGIVENEVMDSLHSESDHYDVYKRYGFVSIKYSVWNLFRFSKIDMMFLFKTQSLESKNNHKQSFLFLSDIEGETYKVFFVNPTNQKYANVKKLTGALTSMGDDLLETSKAVLDLPGVSSHSYIQIDDIDWRERDFIVWYQLDLVLEGGSKMYVGGSVPKHLDPQNKEFVGYGIGKEGWILELTQRPDGKSIDEIVKTMNMSSRYVTFEEK